MTPGPTRASRAARQVRQVRQVRLGTRASALAVVQAELVARAIIDATPDTTVEIVRMTTRGDRIQDRPLAEIGGRGLFVTDIENALRAGEIDIAVHSAKDLPGELAPDMAIAAFTRRANPQDVLISANSAPDIDSLAPDSVIGTSSPRRECQLRARRGDLDIRSIRGNVDTRLRKLDAGEFDAIVLAAAGLERLGVHDSRISPLPFGVMLPAAGQGALAIEARRDDADIAQLVAPLDDPDAADAVRAERAFLRATGGGCDSAVAVIGEVSQGGINMSGMIGAVDGRLIRGFIAGNRAVAENLGAELARDILGRGGAELLATSATGAAFRE